MFKKIYFSVLLVFICVSSGYAQNGIGEIIFSGSPIIKISEGGVERVVEKITTDQAPELKCIITKIDDKYFWTTRNNVELTLIQGGAFLTFVATSGAGYIRIISPELKDVAVSMSETEKQYDYVEHMLIGLKSVTYFGNSK